MHFKREGIDSCFNLPRDDGVAYCAQDPWIQNATVKVSYCTSFTFFDI